MGAAAFAARVVFEATSDEGYPAQMAAAFASGQVPSVVTHLPHFALATYWQNGLLEPLNDVIDMIGTANFYEGANRIYEITPGQYAGTGIGLSVVQELVRMHHGSVRVSSELGRGTELVPPLVRSVVAGLASVRRLQADVCRA